MEHTLRNVVNVLNREAAYLDEMGKAAQRVHIPATKAQFPATRAHIKKCCFCHGRRPLQILHMSSRKTEQTRAENYAHRKIQVGVEMLCPLTPLVEVAHLSQKKAIVGWTQHPCLNIERPSQRRIWLNTNCLSQRFLHVTRIEFKLKKHG